jgi:endonuclease YncB( thermonuclease family)
LRAARVDDKSHSQAKIDESYIGFYDDRDSSVSPTFTRCSRSQKDNCVVDGDTLKFQGMSIRIEDLDTPEAHRPAVSTRLT